VSPQRINAAQIAELLAIAGSRRDANDSERVEAIKSLLCEYREQISEYQKHERGAVHPLLMQGIEDWGRRIFADANPTLALERFLGERTKPGKRAKNRDRDLSIALAVVIRETRGTKVREAIEAVAWTLTQL
jgi:hypothetical protein